MCYELVAQSVEAVKRVYRRLILERTSPSKHNTSCLCVNCKDECDVALTGRHNLPCKNVHNAINKKYMESTHSKLK